MTGSESPALSSPSRETDHARKKRRTAERLALIERFGNRCAICGNPPKTLSLNVDHDHKTGGVRGLLCIPCNRRLPRGVTASWLRAAAEYLDGEPVTFCAYCGQVAPAGANVCHAHSDLPGKETL